MRSLRKLTLLLCLSACNSGANTADFSGTVDIAFNIPGSTLTISSVMWTITQGTTAIGSGTINTGAPGAKPSFDTLIPAGTGYVVALTGMASNGSTCSGSTGFVVTAGATTPVSLTLSCVAQTASTSGAVDVQTVVSIDSCPVVTGYNISPTTQTVGQAIEVTGVVATDADSDTLSYGWSQSGGPGALAIGSPATTTPTVTCATAGTVTLVLSVSDNHTPTGCSITQDFSITCL
jgi:hypothetical protein